ncbi:MAG TPA: hypothetical protein VHB79_20680 [Polyangiaceae bacterium]|nr:hypothetical protein [Polyangiaceae bacterium]
MKAARLRLLGLGAALALAACSDAGAPVTSSSAGAGTGGAAGLASAGASAPGTAGATSGRGGTAGVAGSASSSASGVSGASGGTGGSAGSGGGSGDGGSAGNGGAAPDPGPVKHHVMAIEYPGRLVEISTEGQKLWEHQTPSLTVMFNVLPNGHIFYPHGGNARGAEEIDRDHHVVWSYDSAAQELLGGERLPNGNSLLGEGGPPKALELDAAKSPVRSIDVTTTEQVAHGQIRHVHRLASGNVLLALESEGVAREIDASGKTIWQFAGVTRIHEALRLANGNTLIGGGESKRVLEVTPAGEIAWEFNDKDAPDLGLAFITSVQPLKNGDLLVGNWVGGNGGPGVHAFQVTRDKRVVWTLDDHQLLKSATTVTALDD